MKKNNIRSFIIMIVVIVNIIIVTQPASAQIKPLIGPGGYAECATDPTAVLQLSCFLTLLGGVMQFILGISGALALGFFIFGGFKMLISRGNEQKITEAKEVLSRALIGVIIIFGAYFLINFLTLTVLNATIPKLPKDVAPITKPTTNDIVKPKPATFSCECTCTDGYKQIITTEKEAKFLQGICADDVCSKRSVLSNDPTKTKVVNIKECNPQLGPTSIDPAQGAVGGPNYNGL